MLATIYRREEGSVNSASYLDSWVQFIVQYSGKYSVQYHVQSSVNYTVQYSIGMYTPLSYECTIQSHEKMPSLNADATVPYLVQSIYKSKCYAQT